MLKIDSATSWKRYWALMERVAPGAVHPEDRLADRLVELAPGRSWLDAGCGRRSAPAWREDLGQVLESETRFFGCDLDCEALHDRLDRRAACGTMDRLPFQNESFDVVSSNMVFEHIEHPESVVAELARVTRPGGRIVIHTVNARHYLALIARLTPFRFHQWAVSKIEGRPPEDVYPTQYRANTTSRLSELFEQVGCATVGGGEETTLPMHVPYRGLFWIAFGAGLLERLIARIPGIGTLGHPNLLMEFERRT